ncbi:hypothetical protein DL769_010284 [Monosporascus sp. CRB-8-3]|nr:hypothetical protein DL769_010284 [Monosporascus sp. CRB-8-3]
MYPVARRHDVIVSGGGGHGPAARDCGPGADQIPETGVLLVDGKAVAASACENADLYRALRGGGPGHGIALSATVKAHPNVDVVVVRPLPLSPQPSPARPTRTVGPFYDAGSALGDPVGGTPRPSRRGISPAVRAALEAVTGGGGGREKQERAAVAVVLLSACVGRDRYVPGSAWMFN